MLDTRMPPISTRTRRSHSTARPETYSKTYSEVRPLATPRTARREQAERAQAAAEPIRRALPSARQSRLGRSEMRLMGLATACTGVVCALLLLYLAAYAHVTQLGIEQAQARTQLRQNQLRNELLQAECNTLESPQRIVAAATAQGMTPRGETPVNYVTVAQSGLAQGGAEAVPDGHHGDLDQGSNGGTTKDSSAAASFHH